ncbi:MAG: TolC family protein [Thermodesulfobacteriota bacterium]
MDSTSKPLTIGLCGLWILSISAFLIGLYGCGPSHRYNYEKIRKEYAGVVSKTTDRTDGSEKSFSGDDLDTPLTMQDVIGITLKNNPDAGRASWRIERSQAMLALADTAFWPAVGFYTEYMQGDAPSAYLFKKIDQRMLPQQTVNFNDPGWFENFESGLRAKINLFNGGKDYLGMKMAEKDLAASRLDRKKIENELTAQAIRAFYDAVAARQFIRIAEESVAAVSEQLRITKVHHEGGSATKAEELSLKVRLARAREQVVESTNRYQLALASIAHLMGLDPSVLAERKNPLTAEKHQLPEIPDTYESGIIHALQHRPELAKIRKQLVKSRMGLDAAKSAYLPSVDLMGKYYFDDANFDYDSGRENWTTALTLNWDLFAGFSRGARVSAADAMVKEMLAADRQATLGVKLEVKSAYLNKEEARSRYEVAESSVAAAEESYRLVKQHYKGGAVTITRYLEAELDRNRARTRATAAYYDKIKAAAEVGRAVGMWSEKP